MRVLCSRSEQVPYIRYQREREGRGRGGTVRFWVRLGRDACVFATSLPDLSIVFNAISISKNREATALVGIPR